MKKLNNPKMLIFLSLFFLIGLIFSYSIKDWVREILLLPIIDALLWLYVVVDSISQIYLWAFFLVLGTLYVIKSVLEHLSTLSFQKKRFKKVSASDYLLSIINLMGDEKNRYTQQRLAKYLAVLYFEIKGNPPRYYRHMIERLNHLEEELPLEVAEVFKFGLQVDLSPTNLKKKRFFFTKPKTEAHLDKSSKKLENGLFFSDFPTQEKFEKTLLFLEQQLFMHQEMEFNENQ